MSKYKWLAKILEDEYGVGVLAASPITIEWAAHRLARKHGSTSAQAELDALNARRIKMGKAPCCPGPCPLGHSSYDLGDEEW